MGKKELRLNIFVKGRVQGVAFRWWVRRLAQDQKLGGWVKNLDDGRVEIVVEGSEEKLTKLIKLVKKGPPLSKVEDIDVNWKEATGEFSDFEIVR